MCIYNIYIYYFDFKVSAKRSFSNRLSQSNGESVELHTVLCTLC